MTTTATVRTKCTGTRKDGAPCQSWTVNGSAFCQVHDPGRAAAMAEARRKGGRARHGRRIGATGEAQPVKLSTLADVLDLLTATANDLRQLENSVSRGRALVALAGAWAACYETSELERRVTALEMERKA